MDEYFAHITADKVRECARDLKISPMEAKVKLQKDALIDRLQVHSEWDRKLIAFALIWLIRRV